MVSDVNMNHMSNTSISTLFGIPDSDKWCMVCIMDGFRQTNMTRCRWNAGCMRATTAQHASEIRLPALHQVGMQGVIYIHACWAVARMQFKLSAWPFFQNLLPFQTFVSVDMGEHGWCSHSLQVYTWFERCHWYGVLNIRWSCSNLLV